MRSVLLCFLRLFSGERTERNRHFVEHVISLRPGEFGRRADGLRIFAFPCGRKVTKSIIMFSVWRKTHVKNDSDCFLLSFRG